MADSQQFCLRWNNHQSTLVQVIDSLLSSGILVDCTLAAEGQYLNAHKVVLCACSPYLEAILSQHYEKHPIVILKDVKFQELKSMMDYMYKGEVNISQDQLAQFLKAAESLQIKGLTDGGGENDSRDVGSTSQKRHEPTPVKKAAAPHQSRSPHVLPSHSTGLTIEPSKRSLPAHLSETQPGSPIRSRESSSSPTSHKRRRQRRPSQGDEDAHQDNSCDLPMPLQTMSISSVPTSIPPLPSGSSSTITKPLPPDDDSENPENDRLSGLPAEGYIKEKIEPHPEMLLEPKTEFMEEMNNDDSVEDLTLDDDDEYENMMNSGPGPSHSSNNLNEDYAAWQQMTGDRQDDAYLNSGDNGPRDSQGSTTRHSLRLSFTPEKLAGLKQILSKRRVFSPEDIRNIATYFKLQESKCRIWFKENGARLRRQACSVRVLPDTKKSSSDRRKSYVLKVRKRSSASNPSSPKKGGKLRKCDEATSSSEADAAITVSEVKNDSSAEIPRNQMDAAAVTSEETFEYDADIKLVFSGTEVSDETETENSAALSQVAEVEGELANSNSSGNEVSESAVDGGSSVSNGLGVQRL